MNTSRLEPRLVTERMLLRVPTLKDIPEIIRHFRDNEAHLAPFEPSKPPDFYSEKYWLERISQHHDDYHADRAVRFYLFEIENGVKVVGTVGLTQIFRGAFQACYLGYGLGESYQGKGFMFEAVSAVIHFSFHELNIHRVMANHLPENERSARLLKRLGFQRECVAREYLNINGTWRDHVLNSLHNPDWRAERELPLREGSVQP
jgi:ribosomal-protein-alanine N-acetyltransferase